MPSIGLVIREIICNFIYNFDKVLKIFHDKQMLVATIRNFDRDKTTQSHAYKLSHM